jgi:hypothetical protein
MRHSGGGQGRAAAGDGLWAAATAASSTQQQTSGSGDELQAASPPRAQPVVGDGKGEALPTTGAPRWGSGDNGFLHTALRSGSRTRDPEGGCGEGDNRRRNGWGQEAAGKEATVAPRPSMGALLEAVVKEATQTRADENPVSDLSLLYIRDRDPTSDVP